MKLLNPSLFQVMLSTIFYKVGKYKIAYFIYKYIFHIYILK